MRFWWWLLLLPGVALAKTENWPQLYNTGVTAYQSNDFARASKLFENATSSADRALQQRALYNLGNTNYRLGQTQPAQTQQLWQRALKSYETAMALDPKDADARYNHDFVKNKLEELKKQQRQRQNQKDQQDKKQDQQKDNQQERQPQQKQDQQQQKPEEKQSDQQKQQSQQSQEAQKEEQKQKEEQQQAQQDKPTKPEQQPQEKNGQPQNYDKMQATAMLDDLREDERNWNFFPEVQMKDLKDSGEPAKDW